MEFYKFINEYKIEKFKKGFVVMDNRIYSNPSEETLRKAGYKELVISDVPEYDENTQYLLKTYIDGDRIIEKYCIMNCDSQTGESGDVDE